MASTGDEQMVAMLACPCENGYVVIAVAPDGREFVTDAKSSNTSDLVAWVKSVRKRIDAMDDMRARLRLGLVWSDLVKSLNFVERKCSECGGSGALLRLVAPSAAAIRAARTDASPTA